MSSLFGGGGGDDGMQMKSKQDVGQGLKNFGQQAGLSNPQMPQSAMTPMGWLNASALRPGTYENTPLAPVVSISDIINRQRAMESGAQGYRR